MRKNDSTPPVVKAQVSRSPGADMHKSGTTMSASQKRILQKFNAALIAKGGSALPVNNSAVSSAVDPHLDLADVRDTLRRLSDRRNATQFTPGAAAQIQTLARTLMELLGGDGVMLDPTREGARDPRVFIDRAVGAGNLGKLAPDTRAPLDTLRKLVTESRLRPQIWRRY